MKDTSRGLLNLLLKRLRIDASVSERAFPIHAAAEAIQKHYEEKCIKTADETRRNTLNFVLDTLGIRYVEAQPVGSITPDSGYITSIRKHYEDRAKAREVKAAARARAELLDAAPQPPAAPQQQNYASLSPNASAWQDDIGRVTNERGTAEVWVFDGRTVEPLYTAAAVAPAPREVDLVKLSDQLRAERDELHRMLSAERRARGKALEDACALREQLATASLESRQPDGYVAGITPGTLASLTLWPDPETALRYCPNATCTEEVYIGRKPLSEAEPSANVVEALKRAAEQRVPHPLTQAPGTTLTSPPSEPTDIVSAFGLGEKLGARDWPTPFTPQAQQIREELEGLPEYKRAELPTHDSPPKLPKLKSRAHDFEAYGEAHSAPVEPAGVSLDSPALIEADRLVREGWEPIPDSLEWAQHRFVRHRPHQRVGMETILAMHNLAEKRGGK